MHSGGYNIVKQLHNVPAPDEVDAGAVLERLFELAILITDVMEGGLAERGLTRARAEVLWRLHRQGPMTQRELSEAMRCTPRNVTGLVDALERDGYATRGPHPTDRRATLVTLTGRGAEAAAGVHADYRQGASMLLDGIPAADLAGFLATTDQVVSRLRATTAEQTR
jgi:DNA-binding MarR family transcriptional regulator